MTTAVDTSVLLDLLTDDPTNATASGAALRAVTAEGRLVVCECVLAELRPALSKDSELRELLDDFGIDFVASSKESAMLAGRHLAKYLSRGGPRGRIVPDFLIGAHAEIHADRLLVRDRGFFRDYFSGLRIVDPGRVSRRK